jgi:hypothetical protein
MLDSFLSRLRGNEFRAKVLGRVPVWLVAGASLFVIAASVAKITRTTMIKNPIDMWEAATVSVAARVAHGEPMYAAMNEPTGIEPGLYSPLQPVVLAAIFHFTGPSLLPARIINLLAGALFIIIFLCALEIGRGIWLTIFAVAVLLAIDEQLSGLWALPRTDAVPLLCALVFVSAAFRACSRNSIGWTIVAHAALLAGFFWKQTIVAIAPAPLLAALLSRSATRRMIVFFCLGPVLVLGLSGALIYCLSPNMYEAMFRTAARFAIQPRVAALYAYGLLLSAPLIGIALLWITLSPGLPVHNRTKFWWAVTTAITALPLDFLAAAKVGGGPNSLAHLLYSCAAAVLCCALGFEQFLNSALVPLTKRCLFSAALASGLALTWLTVLFTPSRVNLHRTFGDSARPELLRIVKSLPGKVVSPQDPSIVLEAKGYAGVASVNEWDRRIWQWPLPKTVQEMEHADYVVTWGATNTWETWTFDPGLEMLPRLGFEPMPVPGLQNSHYTIWKHVRAKE